MYVHIGDTISVPIESIITMVHAKGGKSHKSPIHHYETLEYIAMVPEEQIKTYAVSYTHLVILSLVIIFSITTVRPICVNISSRNCLPFSAISC